MAKYDLTFAGYKGEKSIHAAAALQFADALTGKMGDEVHCAMMPDTMAQGHKSGDLPAMVASGEVDLCYMATVRFAKFVPELILFDLPYIADERAQLFERLDGDLGAFFIAEMEKTTPYKVLGFWDNGLRQISNRLRPIESLEDCKGIAIRTQLSEVIGDSMRAMGFTPKPMDIKIYREQIDTQDIQAQDNDLPTIYNFGIHKHHPFITLSGHILGMLMVICSQETYASWSADMRTAVHDAVAEASAFQRNLSVERDANTVAMLKAEGTTVTTLTADAMTDFRAATAQVREKYRGTFTNPVFDGLF
jgi:TRAP-type C4-dicarboxylate transport system substrate-binding protein